MSQVQGLDIAEIAKTQVPQDGKTEDGKNGEIFVWFDGVRYELGIPGQEDHSAARDRLTERKLDPLDVRAPEQRAGQRALADLSRWRADQGPDHQALSTTEAVAASAALAVPVQQIA